MITTDPTLTALLVAIAKFPDEDTPRLQYADRLGEIGDAMVQCPNCTGARPLLAERTFNRSGKCIPCKGRRFVLDTTNADRAEFIRLQVELERQPQAGTAAHARESALLRAHPEWLPECPVCVSMRRAPTEYHDCKTGRVGVMRRGFLDEVSVPRLADVILDADVPCPNAEDAMQCHETGVMECCKKCDYTGVIDVAGNPTPWALAMPKTVRRVYCGDRVPAAIGEGSTWFGWYTGELHTVTNPASLVPHEVWVRLTGYRDGTWDGRLYPTADAARDALAESIASVVRG